MLSNRGPIHKPLLEFSFFERILPLAGYQIAWDLARAGKCLKIILKPDNSAAACEVVGAVSAVESLNTRTPQPLIQGASGALKGLFNALRRPREDEN